MVDKKQIFILCEYLLNVKETFDKIHNSGIVKYVNNPNQTTSSKSLKGNLYQREALGIIFLTKFLKFACPCHSYDAFTCT